MRARGALLPALALGLVTAAHAADEPREAVSPQQAERIETSSLGQAVQGQEGLTIQTMCTNCNEANLELAGLGDAHINVEMDGFRLFGGLPRIYAFSIFPPAAIEKVGVRSGPGLAAGSYEAIGGTIELTSRRPRTRPDLLATAESGSYGWQKLGLLADGAVGFLSGRIAASWSEVEGIDADGDGHDETGATEQMTGLFDVRLDAGRGGAFLLGATRIEDDQIDGKGQVEFDPITREPSGWLPEDTFVEWTEYRFGYDLQLPGKQLVELRLTRYERDQRIAAPQILSSEPKVERYRILEENTYGTLRWRMPVGLRWTVSAGWGIEDDDSTVSGETLPAYLPTLTETVRGEGGFVQLEADVTPDLSLTLGGRYDRFEVDSDPPSTAPPLNEYGAQPFESGSEWSPRASLSWKPVAAFQLRASFGHGYTPARPVFNEICCGQTPERNTDLRPERSRSAALDFTFQPSPAWKWNLYLHHTDFDDYIVKMVAGSVDLKQKLMQGNLAGATMRGASAFLSWKGPAGVSLSGSYTWLNARNDSDTITLFPRVWQPLDVVYPVTLPLERIPYLAQRRGTLSVAWAPPRGRLSLGAAAQYTGSMLIQHYDNVPLSAFPPTLPPGGLREDYLETPGFWLLNLNAAVDLGKHVRLALVLDNVFDEVQDDLDDPSTDYNWGLIRGRYTAAALSYRF